MGGHRNMLTEPLLDPRLSDVLAEVVIRYIATGEPVSSRSLAKVGRFGVSSATIRNVMADLEDLGLLSHPHTSAGRVPTDRGYRYFIDHLMKSKRLTPREREIIDDEVAQASELDDVLQLASRLLSKFSDQVGIVFLPTLRRLSIRSIDLISISERKVMCVIVGVNGVVVSRVVEPVTSFAREELERISNYLTREYSGLSLVAIRDRLTRLMRQDRARVNTLLASVVTIGMEAIDQALPQDHDLFVEGASSILNKPEFVSNADAIRKTMLAFEEKERLIEILNRCIDEGGLQILIGSESQFTSSYNFSLVASRYGSVDSPVGLVGIIGPTRMEYSRVAPLVEYLGDALSRKIEDENGEGRDTREEERT